MLVRLFGSNFRSLKGKFELSLVAADLTREDDRDRGVVNVRIGGMSEPLKLLRAIGIFGPNASGKSTVLLAGHALHWLTAESSRRARPDARIPPYEPFALDDESRQNSITLGCDVVHQRSILRYELTYERSEICSEKLTEFGERGETVLIDRNSDNVAGSLIATSEANRLYVKEMQSNVAVLSKLAQHGPQRGNESARPYSESITSALQYEDYSAAAAMHVMGDPSRERFASDVAYREWIMQHLMVASDVGICDVNTKQEPMEIPEQVREAARKRLGEAAAELAFPDKNIDVSFVHSGKSSQPIDFSDESSGTKKLFNIADDWWELSHANRTLLADELGASLHPRLLDRLVRAVNEPQATRTRSQLVFSTHETGLLEGRDGLPPALRRDQVYFTKKDIKGVSELYSLAEFKEDARPVHNIRKRYLSGMYGAIPSLENLSL